MLFAAHPLAHMFNQPTWYHYAAEVRGSIERLPRNAKEGQRRFQIVLNSHHIAEVEHDYLGTFGDWEYLIDSFDGNRAKAAA